MRSLGVEIAVGKPIPFFLQVHVADGPYPRPHRCASNVPIGPRYEEAHLLAISIKFHANDEPYLLQAPSDSKCLSGREIMAPKLFGAMSCMSVIDVVRAARIGAAKPRLITYNRDRAHDSHNVLHSCSQYCSGGITGTESPHTPREVNVELLLCKPGLTLSPE